jgi:hypothetical protein
MQGVDAASSMCRVLIHLGFFPRSELSAGILGVRVSGAQPVRGLVGGQQQHVQAKLWRLSRARHHLGRIL